MCPVVGYGGMNMHMIDISSVPDARVSCRAALFAFGVAMSLVFCRGLNINHSQHSIELTKHRKSHCLLKMIAAYMHAL